MTNEITADREALVKAEKALLLAARWFKLYLEDETRYEHPASSADLAGMFDAMQEARHQINSVIGRGETVTMGDAAIRKDVVNESSIVAMNDSQKANSLATKQEEE